MALTSAQLESFRRIVTKLREDAFAQRKARLKELEETTAARGGVRDVFDDMQHEQGQGILAAQTGEANTVLLRATMALQRLATGSYGVCVMCCQDIAYARLVADPLVTRCIRCQTKLE